MSTRTVIHADLNIFYASVEMLHHPRLRGNPVAVGGSAEDRHGIILARNYEARAYNVKVGQALWEARQKCPGLIIVPPDYEKYLRFSRLLREILYDYSPQVESFGLDESWVDVTGSLKLFGDGKTIADKIRERVKFELGITASVGVSDNKIFAKLGSDLKKPDGTTVISEDNYREVVWPLPAEDLLGVGRATQIKLAKMGIKTIGDVATADPKRLVKYLGKWGYFLYVYANGKDTSPVAEFGQEKIVKSVGNSTTCPRDLENDNDAHIVFQDLAESVAERLRELGLKARTVEVSLRDNKLFWFARQTTLPRPTFVSTELTAAAMTLLRANYKWEKPLRSIGIRGTNLVPMSTPYQLRLFEDETKQIRREKLEYAIDDIRRCYGHYSIDLAFMRTDPKIGRLDPKSDHVIHPIGYL